MVRRGLSIAWVLVTLAMAGQGWRYGEALGQGSSSLTGSSQQLFSLKSSYQVLSFEAAPQKQRRHSDIFHGQDPGIASVIGTSSLFEGHLVGESEIAYSVPALGAPEGLGDPSGRLLRLKLTGTHGRFRYGMTVQEAGRSYLTIQDQRLRETWGEWQAGMVRIRSSRTETWNNLVKDPLFARLNQLQERVVLTLAPTAWPELSLAYSRGALASSFEPVGTAPLRTQAESLEGALAYTRPGWSARWSSSYSSDRDRLHPGIQTIGLSHSLSGSYRPNPALTLAPSLSFRTDHQQWSGANLNTLSTALSFSYAADKTLKLSASGYYSRSRGAALNVDNSTLNVEGICRWSFSLSPRLRGTLSFETAYRSYLDATTPVQSNEDLSSLVRLQVAGP